MLMDFVDGFSWEISCKLDSENINLSYFLRGVSDFLENYFRDQQIQN